MVLGLTVRNFCYSVQEILAQPSRRLKLLRGQTHRSLPGLRAGPPLTLSAHPQPSSQMGLRSTLWIVVRRQSSAVNLCGASPSGRKPVSSRQSIDTQRHPLSPEREGSFPATAVSLSLQVEEAAGPKPSCLSERRSLGNQKRTLPVSR